MFRARRLAQSHRTRYQLAAVILATLMLTAASTTQAEVCIVLDAGGTADLPPAGCDYTTPLGDIQIIDGLPAGTTIDIDAVLADFFGIATAPGGSLGGEQETYTALLDMPMTGTGVLGGFNRHIFMQVNNISESGPRTPGDAVQSFPTDMAVMTGQIFGDPDFDSLSITAGSNFGLPSPGNTTLTRLGPPGSNWNVDSFFDIVYQIEFQGAPGSVLEGYGGLTTGTVRFQAGMPVPEPTSAVLGVLGLATLGMGRRRRRS